MTTLLGEQIMPARLTEEEFSQHLNTKFHLNLDGESQIDLELVEVKGYASKANEQSGMERFSAFFRGPTNPYLPQRVYLLQHDRMGKFENFLVPIAQDDQGFRYEAVFNYFREH
jgi:hypothetical protein